MSATAAMIDGIKDACEAWGRAMRWVLSSNGEGYPSLATFERARGGELDAKSVTILHQRFGEVFAGDALAISLAIRRQPVMPERLHRILFMHYVIPHKDVERRRIPVKTKALELGYTSSRPYYDGLENAHHFLLGRVSIDTTFHMEQSMCAVVA